MSEISEEERRNYEYLIEKKNKNKKLSKKQKKELKNLSRRYSSYYAKPEKTKEEKEREKERKQQRKFNNADTNGKLMMVLGSIINAIASYIREIIIYLTALSAIFYLYYKFDKKKSNDFFPNDPTKFPYIFVEKNKDYDEQRNLTTKNILNNPKLSDNVFIKSESEINENNGSMDYEKMKKKINQPENSTKANADLFGVFFNYTSHNVKPYEVNLLQIISYTLLTGIIGINTFYAFIHDLMKQLYTMKELSNGINSGDATQQTSSLKKIFGYLFTIFITTILFFLFRLSKNDLSDLLSPLIDPSVLNSKIKNVFGLEELLYLFSSLFSGFFSGFKLLFIVSFIIFIFSSSISLYKLSANVTNLSSIFIILTVSLSFFSSLIMFMVYMSKKIKNKNEISTNEIFKSILHTLDQYLDMFKKFIQSNSLINKMLNLDKIDSGNPFSMIIFVLSFLLVVPFIPIMILILCVIIFFIIFSFIPFIAAIYMGTKTAFDVTLKGFFNMSSFLRNLTRNYIPIVISFILCFFIILNKNDSGNIVKLIESILNTLLFVLTIVFILAFGSYNQSRFKEKDIIIKQEIINMSSNEKDKISKNENTEIGKNQKLNEYIEKTMKDKIKSQLSDKNNIFIKSAIKTLSAPAIVSLGMGFFYIVNHVKKYKNKISKVPIKDISLLV